MKPETSNGWALLPLGVFLLIFVGSGVYFSLKGTEYAFYQISPNVAILPAIGLALFLGQGTFSKRLDAFVEGVREPNIILMCLIYLLAGAFSVVTHSIGSVEATVNFCLSLVPPAFLLPGLFLVAALMATAMGTSMGVIATVGPLAVGVSCQAGLNCGWCMGAIISGAMFGDNLSLVSDTTIASVNTQGAKLREKTLLNGAFSIPAMILTTVLFYFVAHPQGEFQGGAYDWVKILPYLMILGLAFSGVNVLVVLSSGILCGGLLGLLGGNGYTLVMLAKDVAKGFESMQEIFILSLLIGGLSFLIHEQGGLDYLTHFIEKMALKRRKTSLGSRGGEASISILASIADICTSNNTVAIILSGPLAKKLAIKYAITPERSACLLDIFSCVFQGLLPYSAQLLLASSISGVSPLSLVPKVLYCPLLGGIAFLLIVLQWPKTSLK